MLHSLTYGGGVSETLQRQAKMAGREIANLDAPELELGLQLYLQAFFDLDSERPRAFSVGRIPHSAIRSYSRDYGFDEEQEDALGYYVGEMDSAYLKHVKKKEAAKDGKSKRSSKTPN